MRVLTIATTVAVATIILTIVTVTGVTQRRGGTDTQTVALNGTNSGGGSGGTDSPALANPARVQSALSPTPQVMRGAHTTQTVVPVDMNRDLRQLRHIPSGPRIELPEFRRHGDGVEREEEERDERDKPGKGINKAAVDSFDAVRQLLIPTPNMPALNLSFDGQDLAASGCNCSPPDTVGDIGSKHYIQNVNSTVFKIWDKTGTVLQSSTTFNSLWGTGGTNPCTQGLHFGDPVVFYDQIADRWVMSDFAFGVSGMNTVAPYYECIAVAKTSDPVAGGWWLYAFQHDPVNTDWLGDYPKFGNWLDGWYGSYNMFCGASSCTFGARNTFQGVQVNVYDRTTMLTGAPTTTQIFRLTPAQAGDSYSFLPATYRFGAPPAGRNEFYAAIDSPPTSDPFRVNTAVHIYKFHADFAVPANSTFTGPTDITVSGYIDAWNASESGNIVPQSGTAVLLDTVGDRLFMNLWYQNLGGTESLWAAHTIRTTSTSPSSIRWYQFDMTGNTVPATPTQQGTWDGGGDGLYRWMPSLALDKSGNMAIGYTASDASSFPSIRYNGRLTTDTAGTLGQGESTLVAGTGSSTGGRWGDYSATSIDPADGCTFWHTNEYLSVTGTNWKTRVGSFTFPACVAANDGTLTGTVTDSLTTSPISGVNVTATSGSLSNSATTNGSGVYTMTVLPGSYDLTASKAGYANGTANGVAVTLGNTTIQNFALTSSCSPVARTWIGLGAGGAGTDFNTATNWSPNGVPQPCDNLTMNVTRTAGASAIITLSSSSTINSLAISFSGSGNSGAANVFRLDVQGNSLTINTTTTGTATNTGGNAGTQLQFNVGNGGRITYAGDTTYSASTTGGSGVATTFCLLGVGNTTGEVVYQANVTFNAGSGTSSGNTPGKVTFDAPSSQTITDNAGTAIILLGNSSTEIGSANSPTVTVAGTASNFQPQGNLNVNGSSTLDLTTRTFNRSAAGGTFTLNAGTTLKLAAGTGGQTGSNFPLNFTTSTLNATSTVDYNGVVAQTVFATPAYGNLKISNASTKSATAAVTVVSDITIGSGATFAAGTSLTHNIGGNWINNGTFSFTTGNTINFNTAGSKTISGSSTTAFSSVTVNKGTNITNVLEATGPMTMSGNLTLTNGLLKLTHASATAQFNAAPTIAATAGVWVNGGTLNSGNFSTTNNGLIRVSTGSAAFGTLAGNALTNAATGTVDVQGGTTNVSGRLLNSGGVLTMSGGTLRITTVGLSNAGNAGFEMNAASTVTITNGTVEFQNANSGAGGDLKISSGGTKSITGGTFQIGNASTPILQVFKINSAIPIFNLTINATNSPTGRLDTSALTVSNNVTLSGGTLDAATNNLNMTVGGNWSNNGGAFSPGAATVTFNSTTAAQTIGGTAASQTFNAVTVNKTGQTLSVGGSTTALTLNGAMTLSAGAFAAGTATNINIAGNWTNNGGAFTPGSGTVTFNSTAAAQSVNGTATSQTFNKITVSKTGQILSIGGSTTSLTVSDTLLVSAGVFDQGTSSDLSANTISVSAGATLRNLGSGDLTVGSGGVANAGTINFDGSGGGCGNADAILIRSSSAGVQRSWSGIGTFSVSDVNVQDQAGTAIITVFSGTNNGNNGSNWVFVNGCTGAGGQTYVWVGPTLGNDSWTLPANWKLANSSPAVPRAASPTDVLIFDGSSTPTPTVSAIPTQTIAALRVINGAFPSFSTSAANTLTIDPGVGGLGFDVGFLNLTGSNALTIKLASGTGNVSGTMTVAGGGHRLISNSAGAITFPSGAIFTTDTGFTGNAFGTGAVGDGAAGSILFQSGASYFHHAGNSPFGASGNPSVVTFQTGSFATYLTATGFDANGRTYATLTIGSSSSAVNVSDSGPGNFQFDNLVINSTSTTSSSLTYTGSLTSTITIQGNITSVGAGSGSLPDVILTAGSGGIQINKPGGGTVTFGSSAPRSLDLESNTTLDSGTTLNLGRLVQMGLGADKVLTANGTITPNFLATGYVLGAVRKPTVPTGSFIFPVGSVNGYTPVDLTNTTGGGDFTVLPKPSVAPVVNASTSLKEYWTLTLNSGSLTTDMTFHYLLSDVMGSEANYRLIRVEGGTAVSFTNDCPNPAAGNACVDFTNHQVTIPGVSAFSDWTVGEPAAPTAVRLTGFTATEVDGEIMLKWQTGYEARNLGYYIYREQNGQRTRITPSLVAGSALRLQTHTVMGAGLSYTWYDRSPAMRGLFAAGGFRDATYWLEDVDVDGTRTLHGPIAPATELSLMKSDSRAQSETLNEVQPRPTISGVKISGWPAAFASQQSELLTPPKGSSKTALTQRDIAGTPGVKISVAESGWRRITVSELLAAGLNPKGKATQLQLYANAIEVPIKLSGDGKLASESDYFEFYGHALDSPTDKSQTYYLLIGNTSGKRISVSNAGRPGEPGGPESFDYTLERKDRSLYYAGLLNGDAENFFGDIVRRTLANEILTISHLDSASGGQARLEVSLAGVTKQTHNVSVSLNGQSLGTIDFNDNENPTMSFDLAASLLTEGDNTVQLTALNGDLDISLVEKLRITYPHLYVADNNALTFSVNSARTKRISGFTAGDIRVVDITDPGSVTELKPAITQDGPDSYLADVQVPNGSTRNVRTLMVFADSTARSADRIRSNQPSSWWSHVSGSDYVIITGKELMGSLEPLASLRRGQGMVVDVIDVEDIYDEFSFGQHSPQAIHDFLQTATNTWLRKPHFVVLAGDATLDPNDYLGTGQPDVVPTKMLDTTLLETASDDWMADFDGDGVADLAIGRLPVSTPAAMDTVVAKIVSYESMSAGTRSALLVSDNGFEPSSGSVQALLPSAMPFVNIYRNSADDATIHDQIVTALNQGPTLANYFGHGSNEVWTGAPLLSSPDAAGLTNQNRLTVFQMMTCFNGYFQDTYSVSLAEALLKSPGGAVAVWASSGMTDPPGQVQIDEEFYRQVFSGSPPVLGDAVRIAKRTTNDADVRRTWTLFGDPATRLR
jgi:hypothetical protein